MAPDSHAAVLRPLLRLRLLPGAAVPGGGVAGVPAQRGAGGAARGEAGAAHDSVPGAGCSAPGGRGPAARRAGGGDQATPKWQVLLKKPGL